MADAITEAALHHLEVVYQASWPAREAVPLEKFEVAVRFQHVLPEKESEHSDHGEYLHQLLSEDETAPSP